ncbi:ATP-grasp domain-containing protein [Patescibacteria group bacterium]|nr:ATP-grasp domain-containing protein [Patescibacteria group bacterium]
MSQTSLEKSSQVLFQAAQKLNLHPRWLTDWGLISITVNGVEKYICMSKTVVNTQISAYLSANKSATRVILERHGLPNIPYLTPPNLEEAEAFFEEHHPLVAKPTMGQRAEGVQLIKTREELRQLDLSSLILEKYIAGPEFRYLVLQNQVIAVQQKLFDGELYAPDDSRRLSYFPLRWDPQLVDYALLVTKVLGLGFAAVDFKIDEWERPFVLEVNSAPALWRFEQPDEGPAVPVAEMLLKAVVDKMERELL